MPDPDLASDTKKEAGVAKYLLVITAIFGSVIALFLWLSFGFLLGADSTSGTVVGNYTSQSSGASRARGSMTLLYPEVEFQAPDGRTFVSTNRTPRSTFILNRGDKVTVFYDPEDPKRVQAGYWVDLLLFPLIFTAILLFFILNEIWRVYTRRRLQKAIESFDKNGTNQHAARKKKARKNRSFPY